MSTSTSTNGYKGHRAGTMAAKAHKIVDEAVAKKVARSEILKRMSKIGVSDNTAAHWYFVFTSKPKAAKKVNGKAVTKKTKSKK